ncbi:MAG: hypothetical protein DMF85_06195, partial [Acidobacteria bacterium]
MGEVYRARDERLHRTVAIKLVRKTADAAATPLDRERLIDEARAASALNHPNICTVYDVGQVDDRAFIAMEYHRARCRFVSSARTIRSPSRRTAAPLSAPTRRTCRMRSGFSIPDPEISTLDSAVLFGSPRRPVVDPVGAR